MATTKYSVRVDFEYAAEDWWAALDEQEPELARRLRSVSDGDAVVIGNDELERLQALPGWADGPERARTTLIVEPAKLLTITLTGRPPVTVAVDDWPLIAEATEHRWDGEYEHQASRKSKAAVRVRRHEDGRAIVYGAYSHDTQWQSEYCHEFRGGQLVESADSAAIVEAVEDVAEQLAERVAHMGGDRYGIDLVEVGQRCIADLPAEEI